MKKRKEKLNSHKKLKTQTQTKQLKTNLSYVHLGHKDIFGGFHKNLNNINVFKKNNVFKKKPIQLK